MVKKIRPIKFTNDGLALVQLTQGKEAIIDIDDAERVGKYNWYYSKGYAVRHGKNKLLYLHTVINKTPEGYLTDHINRNTLDNCKCNLRNCTQAQNQWNSKARKGVSRFRNVTWSKKEQKWVATIRVRDIRKRIGCFKTEEQAALAYNEAALNFHGEFAVLNIV